MGQGQRNVVLGAIAVVAFGVAGYFIFSGAEPAVSMPNTFQTHGVCLACETENDVRYPAGEVAPFECPDCGDTAVYPLFYCNDCQSLVVPVLDRSNPTEPPRVPTVPLVPCCPNCRNCNLTEYVPGSIPDEDLAGLAPLPPWP